MASSARAEKPLPYDPDQPVPAGYRVEERPRVALAITGGALVATGAAFFVYGWAEERAQKGSNFDEGNAGGGGVMMWAGGIIAAVGAPLLLTGLLTHKTVLVRENVALTPIATPSFGGLSMVATF